MQVRRIRDIDELSRLAGDWNRLSGAIPFRSHEWLATWWRHYQPAMTAERRHVELYVLAASDAGRLLGLAPCYVERSCACGHVVRFLGTGEVCSDYLGILADGAQEPDVAEAFADWLARAARPTAPVDDRWDILELAATPRSDAMPRLLADGLARRKAVVHVRPAENTWRIRLPDSWDGYLAGLSKSHRKQLRQLERRVLDAGSAELRTVDRAEELAAGWDILTQLHQRRLRSLGKPGCFDSDVFAGFHRAASEALYRAGRLRLHWLELGGKPIAAEYHLIGDGVLFAYQGGIEPNALRREPGRLIMLATLARAIAAGYRAFDFCRGDELYKAHWRAVPSENLQWRIVADRSSARLRQSVWKVRHSARDWVKRSLHAARRLTL